MEQRTQSLHMLVSLDQLLKRHGLNEFLDPEDLLEESLVKTMALVFRCHLESMVGEGWRKISHEQHLSPDIRAQRYSHE